MQDRPKSRPVSVSSQCRTTTHALSTAIRAMNPEGASPCICVAESMCRSALSGCEMFRSFDFRSDWRDPRKRVPRSCRRSRDFRRGFRYHEDTEFFRPHPTGPRCGRRRLPSRWRWLRPGFRPSGSSRGDPGLGHSRLCRVNVRRRRGNSRRFDSCGFENGFGRSGREVLFGMRHGDDAGHHRALSVADLIVKVTGRRPS